MSIQREAFEALHNEAVRANGVALNECGVGFIDVNVLAAAARALACDAGVVQQTDVSGEITKIKRLIVGFGSACRQRYPHFPEAALNSIVDQIRALSAAPVAGWWLAPETLTEEMHAAAVKTIVHCTGNSDWPPRVWRALLDTAPTPSRDEAAANRTGVLRRALEIIASGGSRNPIKDADNALVEAGVWVGARGVDTPPVAQEAAQAPVGVGERQAFEAWAASEWGNGQRVPDAAWLGWRGRAAQPATPAAPIPEFDVSTSAGGRGYVEWFFANVLKRHDFARYIREALAADFACALAKWLRSQPTASAAPQPERVPNLDTARIDALETWARDCFHDDGFQWNVIKFDLGGKTIREQIDYQFRGGKFAEAMKAGIGGATLGSNQQ